MVDQIGIHQKLPDDFGVDLNPQIKAQIDNFVAEKGESLSNLRNQFEVTQVDSSPVFKNIIQHFLYSAVDNAVSQISSFLDENAHAHTLLPQDIDQLLSQASEHLKGHATINIGAMKKSTKYRGSKMGNATQAKSGVADAAPAIPKANVSTGASGGGSVGSGSSNNFQNMLKKMLSRLEGKNKHYDYSKYDAQQEKQALQKAGLTYNEEIDISTLVIQYDAAKGPLQKDQIYEEITQAFSGQLPSQAPKKPEDSLTNPEFDTSKKKGHIDRA
ncbi:MAG: hypothetical protein P0S95_04680 [Rhabdochlamydiaceae bacterium]|nr:hypothetical protein [Candidatus Amphrikana amoebophyrae]